MPELIPATDSYWNGRIPVAISNFSGEFIWSFVLFRADLKIVIVVAFLMCGSSEFQTEGPKWEKARSPFVLCLVEALGDRCQHWNEVAEQENRDEGYQRDKRE